jgi:hypothetical protein
MDEIRGVLISLRLFLDEADEGVEGDGHLRVEYILNASNKELKADLVSIVVFMIVFSMRPPLKYITLFLVS